VAKESSAVTGCHPIHPATEKARGRDQDALGSLQLGPASGKYRPPARSTISIWIPEGFEGYAGDGVRFDARRGSKLCF
jgi:hypothetical protein